MEVEVWKEELSSKMNYTMELSYSLRKSTALTTKHMQRQTEEENKSKGNQQQPTEDIKSRRKSKLKRLKERWIWYWTMLNQQVRMSIKVTSFKMKGRYQEWWRTELVHRSPTTWQKSNWKKTTINNTKESLPTQTTPSYAGLYQKNLWPTNSIPWKLIHYGN